MSGELFSNFFKKLAEKIAEENNLNSKNVLSSIESYCSQCPMTHKKELIQKETVSSNLNSITCSYIFEKGPKKGEKCSSKGKKEHNENFYCGTHYTVIIKEEKTPSKTTKATKTTAKNKSNEKSEELIDKVVIELQQRIIRKNKWGNYVDKNSDIIFDKETQIALGNQLDSGKIGPLTKEQISLCEANNWSFKKSEKEKIPTPPPEKDKKDDSLEIEESDSLEIEDESLEEEFELEEI